MPDNQIALKLIEYVGNPVATSSANISGEISGIDIKNIKKTFVNKVDCYLEGKHDKTSVPSTCYESKKRKDRNIKKRYNYKRTNRRSIIN